MRTGTAVQGANVTGRQFAVSYFSWCFGLGPPIVFLMHHSRAAICYLLKHHPVCCRLLSVHLNAVTAWLCYDTVRRVDAADARGS